MIDAITRFFTERLSADDEDGISTDAYALACAALLFEVIRADREVEDAERRRLREVLVAQFDLAPDDLDELEMLAEREAEEATDLFQFTRLVTDRCDATQRIELIEKMWSVAWADGAIDALEEHTIRRVAGLLHVRHADFVAARQRSRPA